MTIWSPTFQPEVLATAMLVSPGEALAVSWVQTVLGVFP
jgi:hypothetical protein